MKQLFQALKASIHKPAIRWTTFAIIALATMGLNAPAQAQGADQKAGDAILIMDYSNSMLDCSRKSGPPFELGLAS